MAKNPRNDILPVIFGGVIFAYSYAREFHQEYGLKSIALTTADSSMYKFSNLMDVMVDMGYLEPEKFVNAIKGIKEKNPDKTLVLVGCRDWQVRMIIENKEELLKYAVVPYIDEDLLNRVSRKHIFYELCDEYGVDHPVTFIYDFETMTGTDMVTEFGLTYPLVAKASNSAAFYNDIFEGQKKVYFVKDEEELKKIISDISKSGYKDKLIIQDMIPGDDTFMRDLTCYCDRNSNLRFASFGHVLLEDQEENSRGNDMVIINHGIDMTHPALIQAERLLKGVGYTGFCDFDIKYDSRDNKYKFFEVNPRLGAGNLHTVAGGDNPVRWIVDEYVDNKELPEFTTTKGDALFSKVAKSNIMTYLKDEELKAKVENYYRTGNVLVPIDYSGDGHFLHGLYAKLYMYKQKKRFDKYLANL